MPYVSNIGDIVAVYDITQDVNDRKLDDQLAVFSMHFQHVPVMLPARRIPEPP
jgi:hypothetical protein